MIGRLQRGIVVLLALGAFLWTGWTLAAGHAAWTLPGLLLLLGGHGVVLAAEFIWMHRVNRQDPAPSATVVQVLRAWWSECTHAPRVFCWRQPFREDAYANAPASSPPTRGVLLLHGFVCNRGIWNPWLYRLRADNTPTLAISLTPPFGSIEAYAPQVEAAIAQLERHTGMPPIVVAHSMGGLALRHWWRLPGNAHRIHHAITLGTPHQGTRLAVLAVSTNGRQMRRQGPWLAALQRSEPHDRAHQLTCFYSHCDNIVFPASTATMPGGENNHLPATAHVAMVDHPQPWIELQRRLRT